jgi:flagellar biosynthesis protein FlhG
MNTRLTPLSFDDTQVTNHFRITSGREDFSLHKALSPRVNSTTSSQEAGSLVPSVSLEDLLQITGFLPSDFQDSRSLPPDDNISHFEASVDEVSQYSSEEDVNRREFNEILDLIMRSRQCSLAMNPSHVGLRNFFEGSRELKECLTTTPLLSISIVQGFWDTWMPTEVTRSQMIHLMEQCRTLSCDYVIIDLSAGAQEGHLELFNRADERIILTSPEPTSIEKTYRFIEALLCYGLKQNAIPEVYNKLISELREYRVQGMAKNFSFRQFLSMNEGLHRGYFDELGQAPLRLLLNSCRSQANHQLGYSIQSVTRKYYDLGLDFLGGLDYDNAVWQSVRGQEAVLIAQPFTPLAGQFLSICKHLIDPGELRAVV